MPDQPTLIELEQKPTNTVEDLMRVAQEASAAVESEEMAALDDAAWIRDQRFRLERLETNHTMNVFAAKVDPDDPDSKSLYTNDTSRKAEVSRRLSNDPAHKEMLAALLVAEKNQAVRKIHIERLQRDYAMAKLNFAALSLGRKGLGEIEI